jgi:hypothetical protein
MLLELNPVGNGAALFLGVVDGLILHSGSPITHLNKESERLVDWL